MEHKINYRHLDNYKTILIVDNYYKIFDRHLLDSIDISEDLIKEVLAHGWKYQSLLNELKDIGDYQNETNK